MCGIAGVLSPKTTQKEAVLSRMTSAIIHRGPDDDGYFTDNFVALGMKRLSIIDLAMGKQPIYSEDGRFLIFFNGEIYNYKELREGLLAQGRKFKTESDTEIVLAMYAVHGPECLKRLRGMFAFCIYDKEKHVVFMARDFFGIKPLYYLVENKKVVAFSSEIKSFLAYPDFQPETNDSAVYNYLSFQYNPLEETFFKNVFKLLPGHYMTVNLVTGENIRKRYWNFEFKENQNLVEKDTARNIFDTLKDSVQHHMISDVPVGAFLSGGIDSSIIATLMQKIKGDKKVKTFTVGFESLTEGEESKETSNFLDTDHKEITVSREEYFKALPKAVWHFDEPVADPSAIGLYFLAQEAAKHVKVVLSGEGADELFGGYNIYLEPFARKKIIWIPKSFLKLALSIPFEFKGKNYLRRASLKLKDWYIGNASIFKPEEINTLWKGTPQQALSLENLYDQVKEKSQSAQMQYIDINTWLVGDILAKADKMTMAHSLELRVPFLDIKVAELAETLPDRFKWKFGVTKYLLRQAFRGIIPESTRKRKKLGFPTPIRNWLTPEQTEIYDTILNNSYILNHMNVEYIKKLISEHTNKKSDNSRKIYLLLMLAIWYNTFIAQK